MIVYINWKTNVFSIKITNVVEVFLSPYFISISMQNLCNKFSNSNKTTIADDFCYFCSESVPFRIHSGCRSLCRFFGALSGCWYSFTVFFALVTGLLSGFR